LSELVRERSVALSDFSGGLNNYWDPGSIADNEVPFLLNMDFSPNGALISRPPIYDSGIAAPVSGQYTDLLGYYLPANGSRYLVASSDEKTWTIDIENPVATWVEVWAYKATGFVQYSDEAVFCKETVGGRRWTVAGGGVDVATMPALDGLMIFRDRFFGWGVADSVNQTKLYFSDIITLAEPAGVYTWNADSVFNIGRGDGQRISHVLADYSKLVIFKSKSTYSLTYSALVEEGVISLIQQGIGAENPDCVANYQNGYVVLHDQILYKFMNDAYSPLNAQKVVFDTDEEAGPWEKTFAVSVFGERAIVWFSGKVYVLNLETGTWSIWESDTAAAIFKQRDRLNDEVLENEVGYAISGSTDPAKWKIYFIENKPSTTNGSEEFQCVLKTKIYDFLTPAEYKRLYWWGVDVAAVGEIKTNVFMVLLERLYSWDYMEAYDWDTLEGFTWDRPGTGDPSIRTIRNIDDFEPRRSFIKLEQGLRFRRLYFEVYLNCDGTPATAPAQIFSITPMVGIKAKMTNGEN
jgi:hypothetical protein